MAKTPVVVLRSNDICFQGIIRSFGVIDVPCLSVTFDWPGSKPWFSQDSKYFTDEYKITNPAENPEQALKELLDLGKSFVEKYGEKLFLIPSSDTNMALMELGAEELSQFFLFIGSKNFDSFRSDVFDKSKTFSRFSKEKLPIPLTLACLKEEDIAQVCEEMVFPCVYKPSRKDFSQSFYSKHNGLKAISVENKEELREKLEQEVSQGFELVVQEKIEFDGPEQEIPFYVYADENFDVRMAVSAIKERIDPYPFGTATVLRLNYEEELLEKAEQIVKAIEWRGLLMIEFIRDKKDGQWKVIELNGRPWLLIDFFRRSGFGFLEKLYQDFIGERAHWESLKVPQWQNEKEEPLCFELSSLYKEVDLTSLEKLKNFTNQYQGQKYFYYLDPKDSDPAKKEYQQAQLSATNENQYFNLLKEVSCEF